MTGKTLCRWVLYPIFFRESAREVRGSWKIGIDHHGQRVFMYRKGFWLI